ncbi:hydroxymethylbilane synthase [Limnobacter parvus]|uniref:Porphobilinogen deaminase n=1 Tax=Limnobacter parvus TaxID=2939690 RepID=A0ABT1XIK4_9BURK|nr:hydroxymethylbilane synthase [Limnobacter parvus]MCR2747014.1 hydroxymethylbilane synthase [Limnobacter parvus]
MKIRIASRESRLAMWQAEHVRDLLLALPEVTSVEIVGMTTKGDQILDRSLAKIGGKGLFIKELEHALLEGRADLAVHSGKDIPMDLDPEFRLLGFMTREDPHDAFVSNDYASLADLPAGAVVGSSSLRRQAQILARYPHLKVEPLRGNLDTRLGKLDSGQYQAIVLAAAGLKRLGLHSRIRNVIDSVDMLPAVGQGALGLEIRAEDETLARVAMRLTDPVFTTLVSAERAVSKALGGSCQVPIAGYATLDNSTHFTLRALVASPDGKSVMEKSATGALADWQNVSAKVIQQLLEDGAQQLINSAIQQFKE